MTGTDPRQDPDPRRVMQVTDEASGLQAWIAVDAVVDGLTAGGLRRAAVEDPDEGLEAAKREAGCWTLACRAAGLEAGGGQILVRDDEDVDPEAADRALGRALEELEEPVLALGLEEELAGVAQESSRVNPEGTVPARAQAVGVLSGIQAVLWALEGDPRGEGNTVLVHGYGPVAGFVAQGMSEEGAMVTVAAEGEARERAQAAGHAVVDADAWSQESVDVLVPAAEPRTITAEVASELGARGVCPALVDPLASSKAGEVLAERNVQLAPDVVVAAGALIEAVLTWREGDAPRVQDEIDRRIGEIYHRARHVLADAADEDVPPDAIVRQRWGMDPDG